jgi:hypothetical protein
VKVALEYGLMDLKRLENMVLRRIAGDFFHLPQPAENKKSLEDNDKEDSDE